MRNFVFIAMIFSAGPVFAAGGGISLSNTNFVVLIAFLVFVGFLGYLGVHNMLGKALDNRADGIRESLENAASLRDEANAVLSSYVRKRQEAEDQAEKIVARAREEAKDLVARAKEDLDRTIARRMQAADDQFKSAKEAALREIRDNAIHLAIGAAGDVLSKKLTAADAGALIDDAIADISTRMN